MRTLLVLLAVLISSQTFAQSMIVLKTGKVLTIDEQGMLYDLGNFILPYQVNEMGGRYLIDDNRKLKTVDRNGLMYSKESEDKAPSKIEYFGENYFISKFGRLYTIDEQGFLYEGEKEKEFRNIKIHGGSFFIAEKKVEKKSFLALFVVTNLGTLVEVNVPGLNLSQVVYTGGQYFTTSRGELYTVSNDGFVYSKKSMGKFYGQRLKHGGNYFVAHDGLYSVSQNGLLMNVASKSDLGEISQLGVNFFMTRDGRLFTVSSTGTLRNAFVDFKNSDISLFSHL